MSTLRTTVLLAALAGLFVGVGYLLGGVPGMVTGLVLAGAMNFFAYWSSDKLALRMAGAHEVSLQDAPRLHASVEEIAAQAGVPKPKVYIIQSDTPNAFATGRNPQHAAVAVTTGIMNLLDAALIQAAISRTREFQADRTGAEITHDPEALASALEKLEQGVQMRPME